MQGGIVLWLAFSAALVSVALVVMTLLPPSRLSSPEQARGHRAKPNLILPLKDANSQRGKSLEPCSAIIRTPISSQFRSAYYNEPESYGKLLHESHAQLKWPVGVKTDNISLLHPSDPTYCSSVGFCARAFSPQPLGVSKHVDDERGCASVHWRDHLAHNVRMQQLAEAQHGSSASRSLVDNGYTWLKGGIISPQAINELRALADSRPFPVGNPIDGTPELFALAPLAMKEVVASKRLHSLCQGYLGDDVQFDDAYFLRTKGRTGISESNSRVNLSASALWHHDTVGHRLKLFIYLSDVSALSATPIARRSHRLFYTAGYTKQLDLSRFSFDWVESNFEVVRMQGRKGDAFIFDTNALHRGAAGRSPSDRVVLVVEFSKAELTAGTLRTCGSSRPIGPLNVIRKIKTLSQSGLKPKEMRFTMPLRMMQSLKNTLLKKPGVVEESVPAGSYLKDGPPKGYKQLPKSQE
jgi:hypothetical protein